MFLLPYISDPLQVPWWRDNPCYSLNSSVLIMLCLIILSKSDKFWKKDADSKKTKKKSYLWFEPVFFVSYVLFENSNLLLSTHVSTSPSHAGRNCTDDGSVKVPYTAWFLAEMKVNSRDWNMVKSLGIIPKQWSYETVRHIIRDFRALVTSSNIQTQI